VGRDIVYKRTRSGFNIKGIVAEYKDLKTQLIGEHQLINAATAVGVIEAMRSQGINVPAKAIRAGLRDARWPGRCEVISRRPLVVLDGAQNIASAEALKKAIGEKFKYKKLILVLGTSSDKDIKGICGTLRPLVKEVILTCSNNPRAARPQVLAGYFRGKKTHFSHCVKEARGLAKRLATPEDLVLVTGSLFVVGEFRNA
jgi:dihydrofolate synthase/folylpolyglutamate synthase